MSGQHATTTGGGPPRGARRRGLRVPSVPAVAALVLLGTSVVALLGVTRNGAALPVAAFMTGALALGSGVLLVALGSRGARRARFRVLLGIALCVWATGQFVQGGYALVREPTFPLPGDVVSFFALPFAVAGVVALPRRTAPTWPTLRMGLDSALLGLSLAFLAWLLRFRSPFLDRDSFDLTEGTAAVVLVADVMVVSLAVLAYLRDLDPDFGLVALGTACYGVGDLVTLYALLHSGPIWPWQGAVLWCLAWPLIAGGLLRYRAPRAVDGSTGGLEQDTRVSVVTTVASVGFLGAGLAVLVLDRDRTADRVSLALLLLGVLVLGVRETLNARLRGRLLVRLHTEATTDPLTGLSNRRVLTQHLRRVAGRRPHALVRVDLEGFKEVNDLFGHAVGDRLLVEVGRKLRRAAPAAVAVSRVGGDDFCLLVPGGPDAAGALAHRLVDEVRRTRVDVGGRTVGVTASAGVAAVRPAGTDVDPLGPLSGVDAALQEARHAGREQVAVYEAGLAQRRRRRLGVEDRLRRALESGGLRVAFQPLVALQDGDRVVGAEALARWHDPELGGAVSPVEFIPVAEQTGLVVELGERILDLTLREASAAGFVELGLRASVNVSPLQLRVPGFEATVLEALERHGVPPSLLVLEVTESLLVEESGPPLEALHRLAAAGIRIAIDDFGSGYSALAYLGRLPASVLKVDRSLARTLTTADRRRAVVGAVVDVARSFDLDVVLEGVEDDDLADRARAMGIGFGQGTRFGDPAEASCVAARARLERSAPAPR